MANIEEFINSFCSSELGYKNATTTTYLRTVATKAKTFSELEAKLHDFDIDTSNPKNKDFALELFDRLGSKDQKEKTKVQELKRQNQYQLVDMSKTTKKTFADEEVFKVKSESKEETQMRDQKERDEFSRRLLEKDKDKSKKQNVLNNPQGITLSAE